MVKMQLLIKSLNSLVFILLLSSCAAPETPIFGEVKIDSTFAPYIEQYKTDKLSYTGNRNLKKISMAFVSSTDYIGVCLIWGMGQRRIEIDPTVWFQLSESSKYVLLIHELGHCDLDLDHTTEHTVMQEYLMSGSIFDNNRDYFLKKLFLEGK